MPPTASDLGTEPPRSGYVPCGSNPDAPWLCIYTKPQAEIVALQHLRHQSFPAYLPLHLATLANRQTRVDPLFPRYLFAQPHNGSWSAIRSTRGIASVLTAPDGSAREVPPSAIDRLLAQCAPNGIIYPVEPMKITPGDTLRAIAGPFAELAGICTRTARDRVWLLLEIMGRSMEVAFAKDSLEPA